MIADTRSCRTFHIAVARAAEAIQLPAGSPDRFRHVPARDDNNKRAEESMTAYLISLALAGMVAIVIWEGAS
jgi:hypothetical protein